jgi:hypothetical protein
MTGFPPTDKKLRLWLLSGERNQLNEEKRLHGFIYALMTVTQRHLEKLDCKLLGETSSNHCQSDIR